MPNNGDDNPMADKHSPRLIEEILPLTEIGVESSKSVSYGAIHAIHTWFARRPLAACRAATFAALVDAPGREAEREELLHLIKESLPRKAPQNKPQVFKEMRERILETFDGNAPKILDPFAGGGSLSLEAARLGGEAYAHDLNPNAVLTLLGTVDYPMRFADTEFPLPESTEWFDTNEGPRAGDLIQAVEAWSEWVLKSAEVQLAQYYPSDEGETVVAYLWAKTIHCTNPTCGGEIPLVAHRWLSKRKGKKPVAYDLIPQSDRTIQVEILHGQAARKDKPRKGTMARGSVQCPYCPQTIDPHQVKVQFMSGEDGRLMLIVAYKKDGESGTFFRPATDSDREDFQRAAESLEKAKAEHDDPFFPLVPDEPLPDQSRGNNLGRYGVDNWGKVHNARQLLALTTFVEAIQEAYREVLALGGTKEMGQAIALYLALVLSRMILRTSEASRWDKSRETIQGATAGHKLPMLWDYAEVNPFSGGSGSWETTYQWALPSIERIVGAAPKPANVAWGDATELPYEENAFDAVLTDPPYYDSVSYSDLSDMQYVWLHRALGDIFPEHFPSPLTPKKAEIIQENARHENGAAAKAFFEEHLSTAFSAIHRVLKPEGIALVMYAHTDTGAWETLVGALIRAGFQVTASWPVNTETRSRQVWLSAAVLQSTIFLVCRKRTHKRIGYLDEILPEMRQAVQQSLARFWAAGIGGADFFISAIGPALSVYSRYDEVRYSSGQRVSVANFLTLVRQAVVDFSLQQALKGVEIGEVDRETQFALLWRWTYGHKKVETGAALLLDKATGVELGALEKRGLLGRVDNNRRMVLYGPEERPDVVEQTLNRLRVGNVPLIDAIHTAGLLWRDNRREELHIILARHGEPLRKVAQALAEIQKNGHSERRLTLGFLGAWPVGLKREEKPKDDSQATQLSLKLDTE
jgi:adenine-specific DNA methylase